MEGRVEAAEEALSEADGRYAAKADGAYPIQTQTLTAATTAVSIPVDAPDQPVAFVLTQDVTGGRAATFDGNTLPIKGTPHAETMVVFTPVAGTWWAKIVDGIGYPGVMGAYDDAVAAIGSVRCYYPLDDAVASTTARNLGTSGVALTKGNTATFGAAGIGDGETSATTGATNGYFFTSADKPLASAGVATVAAIIKLDNLSLNRGLYQAGIKFSLPTTGLLRMLVNGITTDATVAIVPGRRYHVAAVVDGTAHRLYLNGVQVGATTTALLTVANVLNNQICLDGGNFCNFSTWAGVVVTPHALTPAQIASLATAAGL